jgi:hypothetical protein
VRESGVFVFLVAKWLRSRKESLSSERAELERRISEHSPVYRTFQANARIDAEQVRAALPAETALTDLVEYTHVRPPAHGRQEPSYEQRLLAGARPGAALRVVAAAGVLDTKTGIVKKQKNLKGKINGRAERGLITTNQAATLHQIRFLGNDAAHELDERPRR